MSSGILQQIVAERRQRIQELGAVQGEAVPAERIAPLVPFGADPCIICEIKRRSPSRGDIARGMDPVMQAAKYVSRGIRSMSVLTEPAFFGGSLHDLMRIKQQYPQTAVLRKDFLLGMEDIEVSYRAGADAVLLIASVLEPELLEKMHARARELGMQALVELHSLAELAAVAGFQPPLVGVNSRDLATFRMDPLVPLRLRAHATWEARWIFESGVFEEEHAALAASHGFDGVLVGEAVMRRPERIEGIRTGLGYQRRHNFWTEIAARISETPAAPDTGDAGAADNAAARAGVAAGQRGATSADAAARIRRPLIKICGLTWQEDVRMAEQAGADLLGFVFAESPRRDDPAMVARLGRTRALKIGVVVTGVVTGDRTGNSQAGDSQADGAPPNLDPAVLQLLEDGHLDAIQFSGDESPGSCFRQAFPYYKALRIGSPEDLDQYARWHSPRVLVDARAPGGAYGGSGHRIPGELVARIPGPLWLAGGLNPDNIAAVVREFRPELVDVSSGLESHPGKKDPRKIAAFVQEVINAAT